jgi:prolyl-tRNA synthetase
MRLSRLLFHTYRETPSEAEVISHRLMLRASMIQKLAAGIYSFLPLGWRVVQKIANIVREEMNRAGAQEVLLPVLQSKELWEESGRWLVYGPELMRLNDRHENFLCLGPTHEEVITDLVRREVNSYRQLPLNLYQINVKFRDEIRPRFGLMRAREFYMKDAYSFHRDETCLGNTYQKMSETYSRIFDRMGLKYRVVEADPGAIGGSFSHEFMILADTGEDEIAVCNQCSYAANLGLAARKIFPEKISRNKTKKQKIEKVYTPNQKTVEEVSAFLKVSPDKLIKTLIYLIDEKPVAVLIRGDHTLSEVKLKKFLKAETIRLATEEEILKLTGGPLGFSGPLDLKDIKIMADFDVVFEDDCVTGANEKDYHLKRVTPLVDFKPDEIADLRIVIDGDGCSRCQSGKLRIIRGIEVGHIFKLGTKYSEKMKATFSDEGGLEKPFIMGCYGIGITRIAAAAVEQNHDEAGIIWPLELAPFQVVVIPLNIKEKKQSELAEKIYQQLLTENIEAVIDDRDERAGVKFNDADLIGFPIKIIIGAKALSENKVELKLRKDKTSSFIAPEEIIREIKKNILQV